MKFNLKPVHSMKRGEGFNSGILAQRIDQAISEVHKLLEEGGVEHSVYRTDLRYPEKFDKTLVKDVQAIYIPCLDSENGKNGIVISVQVGTNERVKKDCRCKLVGVISHRGPWNNGIPCYRKHSVVSNLVCNFSWTVDTLMKDDRDFIAGFVEGENDFGEIDVEKFAETTKAVKNALDEAAKTTLRNKFDLNICMNTLAACIKNAAEETGLWVSQDDNGNVYVIDEGVKVASVSNLIYSSAKNLTINSRTINNSFRKAWTLPDPDTFVELFKHIIAVNKICNGICNSISEKNG